MSRISKLLTLLSDGIFLLVAVAGLSSTTPFVVIMTGVFDVVVVSVRLTGVVSVRLTGIVLLRPFGEVWFQTRG